MSQHSRRRLRFRRGSPMPREPFWKDEHITKRLTTARVVRLFVIASMLFVIATAGAVIFIVHEVNVASEQRAEGHNERLRAEHELRVKIDEGLAKLRRDDDVRFRQTVCLFVDQFPPARSPALNVLRRRYHCSSSKTPPASQPSAGPGSGTGPGAGVSGGGGSGPQAGGPVPSPAPAPAPSASAGRGRPGQPGSPGSPGRPGSPGGGGSSGGSGGGGHGSSPAPSPSPSPTTSSPSPPPSPLLPVGSILCSLTGLCLLN